MRTSEHQTSGSIIGKSMSLPEDFPVNPSVLQESEEERMMIATCGQKCLEQFGQSDRPGLWQKMFAGSLVGMKGWSSRRCALTWKLKVMKSSRSLFQLLPSTRRTGESGYGLLLTPSATIITYHSPQAMERRKKHRESMGRKTVPPGNLVEKVGFRIWRQNPFNGLLPTPTTANNRNSRNAVLKIGSSHQKHGVALGLSQVVEIASGVLPMEFDTWEQVPQYYKKLLPEPTIQDFKRRDHNSKQTDLSNIENSVVLLPTRGWRFHKTVGMKKQAIKKRLRDRKQKDLNTAIIETTGKVGQLNPLFVQEMMGFPENWLVSPFRSGEKKV